MKKYLLLLIAFLSVSVAIAAGVTPEIVEENFLMDFLSANIEAIVIIVTWLVVRLVPTKWKDPVLMVINWLISIIPDKKSGGGSH